MTSELGHPVRSPFCQRANKNLLYTCAVAYNPYQLLLLLLLLLLEWLS